MTEQDGVASSAKDKIGPASVGNHVDHLRCGDMAIPTSQDMGLGPVMTQGRQETGQNHGMLCASGTGPRTEAGRHQCMRGPFAYKERQIAIALGVMIIEGEFLLAMGGIIGVIEVEHDGSGGLCLAGNALVHQGRGETIDVLAVHTMLEP